MNNADNTEKADKSVYKSVFNALHSVRDDGPALSKFRDDMVLSSSNQGRNEESIHYECINGVLL